VGPPETPTNADGITIRETINASADGFKPVDEAVERIHLIHLVSYQMNCTERYKAEAQDSHQGC